MGGSLIWGESAPHFFAKARQTGREQVRAEARCCSEILKAPRASERSLCGAGNCRVPFSFTFGTRPQILTAIERRPKSHESLHARIHVLRVGQ
jgi:hypothetical protein